MDHFLRTRFYTKRGGGAFAEHVMLAEQALDRLPRSITSRDCFPHWLERLWELPSHEWLSAIAGLKEAEDLKLEFVRVSLQATRLKSTLDSVQFALTVIHEQEEPETWAQIQAGIRRHESQLAQLERRKAEIRERVMGLTGHTSDRCESA